MSDREIHAGTRPQVAVATRKVFLLASPKGPVGTLTGRSRA
jgi:hypothetical protein